MARTPILNLRLDDESKARWTAIAEADGMSLSAFVKQCVEAEVDSRALVGGGGDGGAATRDQSTGAAPAASAKKRGAKKGDQMPHRLPGGETVIGNTMVKSSRARTQMCPHRRKPDEFCSRCDT